jgi:predicted transcriptional regulator
MNLQSRKLNIIQNLLSTDDVNVIKRVEDAIFDEELELSDLEKNSIKKGIKDLEEGKKTPHSEVKKKYDKWL